MAFYFRKHLTGHLHEKIKTRVFFNYIKFFIVISSSNIFEKVE